MGICDTGCDMVQMPFLSPKQTVLKDWRKQKAPTSTIENHPLTSSLLHPPPDSWGKGCRFLETGSPMVAPFNPSITDISTAAVIYKNSNSKHLACPCSSNAMITTAAPYRRISLAFATKSASPSLRLILLTMHLPCVHLSPDSITAKFDESIQRGTCDIHVHTMCTTQWQHQQQHWRQWVVFLLRHTDHP